jgi:hypothetical protein
LQIGFHQTPFTFRKTNGLMKTNTIQETNETSRNGRP